MLPNDLPPWYTVYQQTQRWITAGVFLTMVHDLRMLMRELDGRALSACCYSGQSYPAIQSRAWRTGRL